MATDNHTCIEAGCDRPARTRGMCAKHYMRLYRAGALEPLKQDRAKKGCVIPGCPRPHQGRGYCNKHLECFIRTGNPIPRRDWPIEDRILDIGWTVTESGCWEWNGTIAVNGYGVITSGKHGLRDAHMHRLSFEIFNGPIPAGAIVRHTCDNPPCMNPDHLLTGTQDDNMQDMVERRRHWRHGMTQCKRGHDLTKSDSFVVLGGNRKCRECRKLAVRKYLDRKKAKNA